MSGSSWADGLKLIYFILSVQNALIQVKVVLVTKWLESVKNRLVDIYKATDANTLKCLKA